MTNVMAVGWLDRFPWQMWWLLVDFWSTGPGY